MKQKIEVPDLGGTFESDDKIKRINCSDNISRYKKSIARK